MIQIQNVNKKLDTKVVLQNLNWKIDAGKVHGLVGPNGSGKSTILRLIAGIYEVDSGNVTIDAQPVFENPNIKNQIMFMSDDPFFLHQATLSEMMDFYQSFYQSFNKEIYDKLIKLFLLDTSVKINTFSKGMRRQASLILAFSTAPKYILLDEAFDGLDPVMRLALKRIITDEILTNQMTVIISSHNIRELEDICDEIVLIQNGEINLSGDVETIHKAYHKYQMAFASNVDESLFAVFKPTELEINSKFVTIVSRDDLYESLNKLNPLILEEIEMNLEEIFVYKMKEQGYGKDI